MATLNQCRAGIIATAVVLVFATFAPHAQDSMPSAADETSQTAAAVMATDVHWSLAEMTGDTAWLDQMLLPDYRSVNNDGSVHAKAAILAGAAKRKHTDLATAQRQLDTYEKEHPHGSAVAIHGNTAIVSFYDPTLGPDKGMRSADVFVYVDGRWHAMYSQHTAMHI